MCSRHVDDLSGMEYIFTKLGSIWPGEHGPDKIDSTMVFRDPHCPITAAASTYLQGGDLKRLYNRNIDSAVFPVRPYTGKILILCSCAPDASP